MNKNFSGALYLIPVFFLFACGGGDDEQFAGFSLDMPAEIEKLNLDTLRVSGSVWKLDENGGSSNEVVPERDTERTIRGNYALVVKHVKEGRDYEFRLKVFIKAATVSVFSSSLNLSSPTQALPPVEISTDIIACPGLNLTPDASLVEGGAWLLLCEVKLETTFDASTKIEVSESQIDCSPFDADGDGVPNIKEVDLSYHPYNGDLDGDCVADGTDAFPTNKGEWRDLDEDGIGDTLDDDADGDGLPDEEELVKLTNPFDADTDDDGIGDGDDNCPLDGRDASQSDVDEDGVGDVCDNDADNDGLTDEEEAVNGTDPQNPDSDADQLKDGLEIQKQTNPLDDDSDDDGTLDGEDVFPLDETEWADRDGDGIGDNTDVCPTVSDSDQRDTNGDSRGDACSSDDDGDGVSDTVEQEIGSNPKNPDTDGDGLKDWFGQLPRLVSNDACLLVAKTSGNATLHDQDQDGDGFGNLPNCDCQDGNASIHPARDDKPDFNGLDEDCDTIDGDKDNAIFVDGVLGNESNSGVFGSPVKTLKSGGEKAIVAGKKSVYVADGNYLLTESFLMPLGLAYYGGYSSQWTSRDSSGTAISTSTASVLMEAEDTTIGTSLDGFTLQNSLSTTGTPICILVREGVLSIKNSTIEVVNALHGTAIVAVDANLTLENTTVITRGGSGNGYGLELERVTGTFSGNKIRIADFSFRTAIRCLEAGASNLVFENNQIDVWSGLGVTTPSLIWMEDCSLGAGRLHNQLGLPNSFDGLSGFTNGGGNILDGLY